MKQTLKDLAGLFILTIFAMIVGAMFGLAI